MCHLMLTPATNGHLTCAATPLLRSPHRHTQPTTTPVHHRHIPQKKTPHKCGAQNKRYPTCIPH